MAVPADLREKKPAAKDVIVLAFGSHGIRYGCAIDATPKRVFPAVAQTVYGKDEARYVQNAVRMYPQLKKYSRDLEFGYRVMAVGLDEQPTKPVTRDMALTFTAWAKKELDNMLKGNK